METDPQGLYSDFVAFAAEDYELSSHTRGVSGSFIDQINSQNLLNFTGSYTTATTVRVRNGKVSTTDGPFAETKEQLGGYYLIEAKDLNEAIQVASRIPSAKFGSIEVRPIWAMAP